MNPGDPSDPASGTGTGADKPPSWPVIGLRSALGVLAAVGLVAAAVRGLRKKRNDETQPSDEPAESP